VGDTGALDSKINFIDDPYSDPSSEHVIEMNFDIQISSLPRSEDHQIHSEAADKNKNQARDSPNKSI
jgi:hypothetical protein